MVAREQHPEPIVGAHGFEGTTQDLVRRRGAVEHVAGNEDGVNLAVARELGDPLDGCEAFLAEDSRGVALDRAEGLAELPVGRVKEADRHLSIYISLINIYPCWTTQRRVYCGGH